jgi:biotin carboxylase
MSKRPLLAVVYDFGAAGPAEIAAAARACSFDLVFVIDRSSKHVSMVTRALPRWGQVCDITALSPAAAVSALAAFRPQGLLTFSETRLEMAATLADGCGIRRWHSLSTTHLLIDKFAQREALGASGVDSVQYEIIRRPADIPAAVERIGLPAVLKPCRGSGARYVSAVLSSREGMSAATDYFLAQPTSGPMLLEELLSGDPGVAGPRWGDYVSVESLASDGDVHTICVTGKLPLVPPFREGGYFLPSTVGPEMSSRAVAVAESAIRALGVQNGMLHTEVKLTHTGPRIVEINGRVGGHIADLLRRSSDYDIVKSALLLAMGQWRRTPRPDISRVSYQYVLHSPQAAMEIVYVDGLDTVRALDGVDVVDIRATIGQRLDWRQGALGMLGKVYGQVADHEALSDVINGIESALRVTCSYRHGEPQSTERARDIA